MKSRFRAILILLTTLLLVTSGHFLGMPAHAAKTPTLYISPSSQPLATTGSTITFSVNVSNISPSNALFGWNIYVRTNNDVLKPVAFTVGSFIGSPDKITEQAHCVNNVGTGCDFNDAVPGMVHSLVYTFDPNGGSGNATLFTITYQAVAGPYSLVTFVQPGSDTILFDVTSASISFTPVFGSYGNVPVLPVASFRWAPLSPFAGDKVTFNASSSTTPPGTKLVDHSWVFNAGGLVPIHANGVVVSIILEAADWTVTLVVRNDQGIVSAPADRSFNVSLRLIPDLAIFLNPPSVDPSILLPGMPLTFEASVRNVGTTTETNLNVSLSVPGQVFNAPPYRYLLAPMHVALFMFTWNTTLVQPGTYTIHATVAPLVNETNTANNDSILNLTFVPFRISTNTPLEPTRPHQHKLTTIVTLQSGAGFAGTIMLSSSSTGPKQVFPTPQNELSIHFRKSTIALAPKSFASTTLTIDLGKKTPPGDYIVHVYAASGSFNISIELHAVVPSSLVRMPRLSWNEKVSLSGVQTWEATVVNTLPTTSSVELDISCSTSQGPPFNCFTVVFADVPGESTAKLTASWRPLDGFQLGQTFTFTATLAFEDVNGFQFLSSDVRTGTFTIVPLATNSIRSLNQEVQRSGRF